jgi:F0F1-type ATP synthase epsilon subunit
MPNKKQSESIKLTMRSREGAQFINEEVFAVTSKNQKGVFDVLPEHENFITIIKDFVIVHKKQKDKQEIKIGTGVLKVTNNIVNIFLGMHSD